MRERIRFDTESIMYLGPTMMIQWATQANPNDIHLHDVFDVPVKDTISLIGRMAESTLVGFNLSHDAYHLCRTLNCLMYLNPNKPPDPYEYREAELQDYSKELCFKPFEAVDLMIVGRRDKFQGMMRQKPVQIDRVARVTAEAMIKYLKEGMIIPDQYFAKNIEKDKEANAWKMFELHLDTKEFITPQQKKAITDGKSDIVIDPDFVSLRLDFNPSANLKSVAKYHLGFTDTEEFEQRGDNYEEKSWWPCSGDWIGVYNQHKFLWENDPKKRDYARRDVVYTTALDVDFGCPKGDGDSMLATMVGNTHWCGYAVDLVEANEQYDVAKVVVDKAKERINYNSPMAVKEFLHEVCEPVERLAIRDTTKETIKACLSADNPKLIERAQLIIDARDKEMELRILERLVKARRLYVTFNVSGTRTNRMAGGDAINKTKGSINPQGIKKGKLRKVFTFADKSNGEILSNGDFKGFEVAIYDAVYQDPKLHEQLLSGKKIHAIWGSYVYGMSYEEILKTEHIKATEPDGFYSRSKNSFFAGLYGAQPEKIAEITWLDEEEAEEALNKFLDDYPTIQKAQKQVEEDFTCMVQPGGIGTMIKWKDPKKFIKSFLGFTRSFEFEYMIVECLFNLSGDLRGQDDLKGEGYVIRKDRPQTIAGANMSAIFSACFSIISKVIKIAGNFKIQSPGGEITKALQVKLTEFQPQGIHTWKIKLFNVHDELETAHVEEIKDEIEQSVREFVEEYKKHVPLLAIDWKKDVESWYEK